MPKGKNELAKHLMGVRKELNAEFSRNDAYGRGMKQGIDLAMHASLSIEKGLVYDPQVHDFREPESGKLVTIADQLQEMQDLLSEWAEDPSHWSTELMEKSRDALKRAGVRR